MFSEETHNQIEAKGKAWFGVIDCFAALDYDWTLMEEMLKVITGQHPVLGNLDAAEDAWLQHVLCFS